MHHGGRAACVFREKRTHRDGHVEDDGLELIGIRRELAVRSTIAVPFDAGREHRGGQFVQDWTESELELLRYLNQRHRWTVASEYATFYLAAVRRALDPGAAASDV
jgi:hypothetical protein